MLLPEKYESILDVSSEGPSSGSLLNFPTKELRLKRRRYFHIFQVEAYLTYCEDTNINELIINEPVITEPEKIADSLNTYFDEIGTVLAKDLPKSNSSFERYVIPSDKTFEINRLSSIEVKIAILKINTSKATGHGRISHKLLKDSADIIAVSLTVIFNKSIETSIFPDDLKVACLSPIHKGESKTDGSNYRPISVISVVAKVFEKLFSG